MVGSVMEGLRNFLPECPLLSEISPSGVDYSHDNGENFGLLSDGTDTVGTYISGKKIICAHFMLCYRNIADTDYQRLINSAFMERLQDWFDGGSSVPELPDGYVFRSMNAVNAMMLSLDESAENGVYQIQLDIEYMKG